MTAASPPAFLPLNMVEQQLIAAANGDPQQQKAFERFILDETLYAATPDLPVEETVSLSQGETLQLLNVALSDGRQAAALFTAPERAAEVFGEVGYVGIQGRVLFEMIRANPAILNPGLPYGVVWEPDVMAAMLGLPVERVVKQDTKIMLGFPATPPTELIARLKSAFSAVPEVEAAWLALAFWPEDGARAWYLDVRTASADHEPIRRALPQAIEGVDMEDLFLDMVINPAGSGVGTGIPIVEGKSDARSVSSNSKKNWLKKLFG